MGLRRLQAGSRNEGFTLIELLVVLAVISLLILAVPAIVSTARPGVETHVAAQDLVSVLRSARQAAIVKNRDIVVAFDLNQKSYSVRPDGAPHQLANGLSLVWENLAGKESRDQDHVTFFADGSSTGARIRIASASRHYWLTVQALSGQVSIDE